MLSEAGRGLRDLFPGEAFDEQRELTFTHPRTGFVVGTCDASGAGFMCPSRAIEIGPLIVMSLAALRRMRKLIPRSPYC